MITYEIGPGIIDVTQWKWIACQWTFRLNNYITIYQLAAQSFIPSFRQSYPVSFGTLCCSIAVNSKPPPIVIILFCYTLSIPSCIFSNGAADGSWRNVSWNALFIIDI